MTDGRADGSRVRTVFLGSGGFGVPALRRLAAHPAIELVGVVTAPPRAAGRGMKHGKTPVAWAAERLGVGRILTPVRLRVPEAVSEVLGLSAGLAVLADYGQIVPPALLGLPHGALNLHPSLLPRHRGATPIPATILAGDVETGVTLMRMDEGLDTGPIVAVERVDLDGTEVAPELEDRLAALGASLLERSIEPWLAGRLEPRPQAAAGETLTRPLRREDGRLDPAHPTSRLERQVRAYQPWPGSFIDTIAGRIVVWVSDDVGGRIGGEENTPGRIGRYGMYTSDGGYLAFREVQPAGGVRMSWNDLVRGRPALVGSIAAVPAE